MEGSHGPSAEDTWTSLAQSEKTSLRISDFALTPHTNTPPHTHTPASPTPLDITHAGGNVSF